MGTLLRATLVSFPHNPTPTLRSPRRLILTPTLNSKRNPSIHRLSRLPKTLGFQSLRRPLVVSAVSTPAPAEGSRNPAAFLGVEAGTLKKVIPLGLMFFCILFNYTILRDTKDVLVITAKGSSAEIIPFIKTWVNLPAAIGFMLVYARLSNSLSKEALFYSCILPFVSFFGLFAFVLYPARDLIHPTGVADRLLELLGPSFLGPIAILRIWSFCIFYVMSELWGSVVVSLLFWGFANQVSYCVKDSCQWCLPSQV